MKQGTKAVLILVVTFIFLAIVTYFLPAEIPLHYSITGRVGPYVSRYYTLLLTPLPYIVYFAACHKRVK